jgi:hypothetical protein
LDTFGANGGIFLIKNRWISAAVDAHLATRRGNESVETAARSPKASTLAAVRILLQYCLFLVVYAKAAIGVYWLAALRIVVALSWKKSCCQKALTQTNKHHHSGE